MPAKTHKHQRTAGVGGIKALRADPFAAFATIRLAKRVNVSLIVVNGGVVVVPALLKAIWSRGSFLHSWFLIFFEPHKSTHCMYSVCKDASCA